MQTVDANGEISDVEKPLGFGGKIFTAFFSYIFHPIFVPVYAIWFLVYIHPSAFSGFSEPQKRQVILITLLNLVFFPLLSVVLLKAVGFIDSILLRSRKDRIIPYIVSGIFFFWVYLVFKQQSQYPLLLTAFVLGIFLASSAALLCNIYFKISMHAIGMGGWLGFFLVISNTQTMLMTWPICLVLLIAGLVCAARLLPGSHKPFDIYAGLLVGLLAQFTAAIFIL